MSEHAHNAPSDHFRAMTRRLMYIAQCLATKRGDARRSYWLDEGAALSWALEQLGVNASERRRTAIDNAIKLFNIAASEARAK